MPTMTDLVLKNKAGVKKGLCCCGISGSPLKKELLKSLSASERDQEMEKT